jgi:hypothetical protein
MLLDLLPPVHQRMLAYAVEQLYYYANSFKTTRSNADAIEYYRHRGFFTGYIQCLAITNVISEQTTNDLLDGLREVSNIYYEGLQ